MAVAARGVTLAKSGLALVTGFDAVVPVGGVLIVRSNDRAAGAALVAAICGRYPVASGDLKTVGLVLPTRAGAVRRRSALVQLRPSPAPVEELRSALGADIELVGLCDVDSLGENGERAAIAELLNRARLARLPEPDGGHDGDRDALPSAITIVASCAPGADVSDVVGFGRMVVGTYDVAIDERVPSPSAEALAAEVG